MCYFVVHFPFVIFSTVIKLSDEGFPASFSVVFLLYNPLTRIPRLIPFERTYLRPSSSLRQDLRDVREGKLLFPFDDLDDLLSSLESLSSPDDGSSSRPLSVFSLLLLILLDDLLSSSPLLPSDEGSSSPPRRVFLFLHIFAYSRCRSEAIALRSLVYFLPCLKCLVVFSVSLVTLVVWDDECFS